MDREAWQATVHGVAKSQTQLKWLSTQHNPHTIQFSHLKSIISGIWYIQSREAMAQSLLGYLHYPQRNPVSTSSHSPFLPTPSPPAWGNQSLIRGSEFAYSGHFIKWNQTTCVLLSLTSCTKRNVFKIIHDVACISTSIIPSYCGRIFYYVHTSHFIHSSIDGYFSCFPLLATVNNTAMNSWSQVFAWTQNFISLRCIHSSGTAGPHYSYV